MLCCAQLEQLALPMKLRMISTHRQPTTNAWEKAYLGVMKELLHLLQQSGTLTMTQQQDPI